MVPKIQVINDDWHIGTFFQKANEKKTYHRPKQAVKLITVWLFSIAMEYGPCIEDKHDDLPIQNGDFPVRYVK